MKVLVIDSKGGGIGGELIERLKKEAPDITVMAVGTNTTATKRMLRAGADNAATGENPVVVQAKNADIIVGPIGIVIADSLMGEITPKMAYNIGASQAIRILIPYNSCKNIIVGTRQTNLAKLIDLAKDEIIKLWQQKKQ